MPELKLFYDPNGSWAALYVDGKLDFVGNASNADERAFELAGVATESDNAFLRGGEYRRDAAQTLEELEAYRERREAKKKEAGALRLKANQLLAEANRLEEQK